MQEKEVLQLRGLFESELWEQELIESMAGEKVLQLRGLFESEL